MDSFPLINKSTLLCFPKLNLVDSDCDFIMLIFVGDVK